MLPLVLAIVAMGGTSGNIGTFYLYNDGHQQWQEQVVGLAF
jgi:hypothetical protein